MSVVLAECTPAVSAQVEPRTEPVLRKAFYLSSQDQPLLAWLHTNQDRNCIDHGVIICSPIGYEQLHSHRSLRHMADALARLGIPTLRFDWHGTGDSAGIDEDDARLACWKTNLRDAVAWMRKQLGCQRISIVGLRMGATLATLALDDEIDNLVLWSPVTKGRSYVREMSAIDLTSELPAQKTPESSGAIETAGFTLTRETAEDLSQINLLQSRPNCRLALIVGRDDLPADRRLFDWYANLGIPVDQLELPGYTEMLAEPHRGQVPLRAIHEISTWLHSQIDVETGGILNFDLPLTGMHEARMPYQPETPVVGTTAVHIREQLLTLSSTPDLFGILCEPEIANDRDLPTIVLLNAGSAYRIGPGRLHVHLARKLASQGFRCLRMDICGLGDSVTPDFADENDSYSANAFRDIEHTLTYLQLKFGMQKCVLMGLCSGAYAAFQSAVSLTHPSLVESVLINPLTFFWKTGMSINDDPVRDLVKQHYYFKSALQPQKWLKLLSGRTSIGFTGALRLLAKRLLPEDRRQSSTDRRQNQTAIEQAGAGQATVVSHPLQENLPNDLRRAVERSRKLAMFFSTTDPGYSILTHKAKREAKRLHKAGQLSLSFIEGADHTFSRRYARHALFESLSAYLHTRFA